MSAIDSVVKWKQKLLDLGKRNRMLYFKRTRRSTLRLISPSYAEIFDRLVTEGHSFALFVDEPEEFDFESEESTQPNIAEPPEQRVLRPGELLTDQSGSELERSLYQLRYRARTAVEEQGVTILFVAFGFLEWTESDASKDVIRSPLVLVPVELRQDSVLEPYRLVPVDDDLVVNPTLNHKLEQDYGITLPDLPGEEDWDLDRLLDQVEALVSRKGWRVAREAYLGLFSFLKLNMYKDLERYGTEMADHPLISAIAGDSSKLPPIPDDLLGNLDLDKHVQPRETYQVVDADSSQQEAILAAKRGVNLVVQGPPGTGKSQTITNMIAECLSAGKRVLFVSEKMAALEVVFRRLKDAGLSDFCLQLHSHNANKKEVVSELGRTLMAARTQVAPNAMDQLDSLIMQRETLNAFVDALHTVRSPLERSAYWVHGMVAKLEPAPDVLFPFDHVGSRTPADMTRYKYLLDQLANTARRIGEDYASNPWRGCIVPVFTLELQHDINTRFRRLDDLLDRLTTLLDSTTRDFGLAPAQSLHNMEVLSELLALAGDSPLPPAEWLLSDDLDPMRQKASIYQDLQAARQSLRSNLLLRYQSSVFSVAADRLLPILTTGAQDALKRFHPGYVSDPEGLLAQRDQLAPFLDRVEAATGNLLGSGGELAGTLGLQPPVSLDDVRRLVYLTEQVAQDPRPPEGWFDPQQYRAAVILEQQSEAAFRRLAAVENALLQRFDHEVLSQGVADLLRRFRTDYVSIFRFLKPEYYRDIKLLRSFLKTPGALNYRQALADLSLMKEILDLRDWISERDQAMAATFGTWYQGLQTDWGGLGSALKAVGAIQTHFAPEYTPEALRRLLIESGTSIRKVTNQLHGVKGTLQEVSALLDSIWTRSNIADHRSGGELAVSTSLLLFKEWAQATRETLQPIYQSYDEVRSHLAGQAPPTIAQVCQDVAAIRRVQEIEHTLTVHLSELQVAFGRFYQGVETHWPAIFSALDWAGRVRDHFAPERPPEGFVHLICTDVQAVGRAHSTATACGQMLEGALNEAAFAAKLFEPHQVDLLRIRAVQAREWLRVRIENLAALEDWVDFRRSREDCAAQGLGPFVDGVIQNQIPPDDIEPAFLKRFYRLWLDDLYTQVPELQTFRGRRQDGRIADFRALDKLQFQIAQSRLRAKLSELRPNPHILAARGSEVATLLRESEKRRKLKPLRKLFREIPNLLLTLKPCLLMSPLSVSHYLDPSLYHFDVVIFDEASQIFPEDAIGAIFRGNQLIVVGDREQLPPTNFFTTSIGDGNFDDDEDNDAEAYESILDACSGVLHRKPLQWHYRSRHEHLIAFSNAQIYKNLVTFPAPVGRVPGMGVEFIHVPNGIYDRSGNRTNRAEAQQVAELVVAHFREYPRRSLGVVTFSEAQQAMVDATIRQLRLKHPELEAYFSEDRMEPFFIKNLENVQGDERDTIIFSVGYARDQSGVMHMNFGPLSRQGGYRRLNVAVTRAKYNVKLVSSIKPTDIDLGRTNAQGVKMLRSYMEFAIHGPDALGRELLVPDVAEFDSPFEEAVYRELVHLGFQVDAQVGCSGYRIDLAIRHPELHGHYLLGVECDGATYHSAKTARDRDRLREDVLRNQGWQIHRIWSTDWVKDPRAEINRLLAAVEKAQTDSGITPVPGPAVETLQEVKLPLEVAVSAKAEADALTVLPGTTEYVEADIHSVHRKHGQDDTGYAVDVMAHVIKVEGPIHQDLLAKRLALLFGRERASSQVKKYIEWLAQNWGSDRWVKRGEFLWPHGIAMSPVRIPPAGEKPRVIGYICPEEQAEAAMLVLERSVGMNLDDLLVETARLLGFIRTGDQIREALLGAVSLLERDNRLELQNGTVRLVRRPVQ